MKVLRSFSFACVVWAIVVAELRRGALSNERVLGFIDRNAARLAEAARRDHARWGIHRESYQQNVAEFLTWIERRLAWMDGQLRDDDMGLRRIGDVDNDGIRSITDAVIILQHLFLGVERDFPCADGSPADPANLRIGDFNDDGTLSIADAVGLLVFLFHEGQPPALGADRLVFEDCIGVCL